MLSAKFIQLIETHSEQIASGVCRGLATDPRTPTLGRLPLADLKSRCQQIVRNLSAWLAESSEEKIAAHFEDLGRKRRDSDMPLSESVHVLHLLKESMIDYIRNQGLAQTSVDIYAEEELEHQVGRFFDTVVYYVIRGYERATALTASASR